MLGVSGTAIAIIEGGTKGGIMSYEVINVNGEERVVREDVAKKHRGINWMILSLGGIILIAGLILLSGIFSVATDPNPEPSPAISNRVTQ